MKKNKLITDKRFDIYERAVTFDGPDGYSTNLIMNYLFERNHDKILDDYKQEYISKEYVSKFHPEVKI